MFIKNNPYIGWRKEIFSLMEYKSGKNLREKRKINQAYRKIVKEHVKHTKEVEQYFRKKAYFTSELQRQRKIKTGIKEIYLVFSFAPVSSMARAIATYTNGNFSHIALSLDDSLNNMYSFTMRRGTRFSDIEGGFTYESIHFYKRQGLWIQVNGLGVTEEQYRNIEKEISAMAKKQKQTRYNLKGLISYVLGKETITWSNNMFCSEFIMYLFEQTGIRFGSQSPGLMSPQDLENVCEYKSCSRLLYRGSADCYRKRIE